MTFLLPSITSSAPRDASSALRDASSCARFDATTLQPYSEETSYENSLLVRQTADLALSSLRHVFKSLTPNARGIFILLAKNQVSSHRDEAHSDIIRCVCSVVGAIVVIWSKLWFSFDIFGVQGYYFVNDF